MASRGQPKKFKKDEFKTYVFDYLDLIYEKQNNEEKDTPTIFGFYKYVSQYKECSYHTIRRCFDEYWADIKKEFEDIRGDLLSRGASLGIYNTTMSIFALKNWCNWKDKADEDNKTDEEKQDNMLKAIKEAVTGGNK